MDMHNLNFITPDDPWHTPGDTPAGVPAAHQLLSPEQWQALRSTWPADCPVGLRLANAVDVETLRTELKRFAVVALHFPKWTDGRAYTQARLLRTRFGFQGQIRATGDVLVDMLPLLKRTGFDAVQLRGDQKLSHARRALGFFADFYQGDVVQASPRFARHLA